MLVGREFELAEISSLLDRARSGQSGVLAIVGEVGIGKSELLHEAEQLGAGMKVLRARGVQSEARVPFAGLLEMFRPVLGDIEKIPEPQRIALEAALALRPPRADDRFAVSAGTLSLLAAVSEAAPVLVLVDDAHWLDGSTADALLFAFRRLLADPVAVLLAVREGEPSLLDGSDLSTLVLGGLDLQASQELLEHRGLPAARQGVDRLYRQTRGNPLALVELAGVTDSFDDPSPLDLPLQVSTSVARIYVQRFRTLPPGAATALLVAAANDTGDIGEVARAARSLGASIEDLEPAEAAGLIRLTSARVEFCHPLARSAIYTEMSSAARRRAHRALAQALPDADFDRRAWHQALSVIGPDDAACAALEQAGRNARDRSGYAVASRAFDRASNMATDEKKCVALLHSAAEAAWLAGESSRAVALLDRLDDHDVPDEVLISVDELRGHIATRLGPVDEAHQILLAGASRAMGHHPGRAVLMLAEAVNAAFYAADPKTMMDASSRLALVSPETLSRRSLFFSSMAQGMALIFSGDGERGAGLVRAAVELIEETQDLEDDPRLLAWAAMGPLWLRESATGGILVARAEEVARRSAAVGVLPFVLSHYAIGQSASYRWSEAEAAFHESIDLARQTDQRTEVAAALARLALLEARQGRQADCRLHAAEALHLSQAVGAPLCEIWALSALGELELGLGDAAAAVSRLGELQRLLDDRGVADADLSPAPELVDAHLRLGNEREATAQALVAHENADRKSQPWALARAARCQGMVAGDDDFDAAFRMALEYHDETPDVFEAARTRLCYGARLRRARRRLDAREQLRRAIDDFDRLGASLWGDVAQTELAATGETARRRDPSSVNDLSPQERHIAQLLADGRTTREAAAALFLSPKTVEFHLRNVYRKLGINSRAELAASFSR